MPQTPPSAPGPAPEKTSYREVMAKILARITQGPWGPGTALPGEVELAEEFGCSRSTMNRALQEIADLGYIDRRRKSGTRVRMAPLRQARFEMPLIRAEIEAAGARYRYTLLHHQVCAAPDWLRARMNLNVGAQVVHVLCLHHADEAAFQLEDRWINATALPQALNEDFAAIGPNEWLVETVPFSEVEVNLTAVAADETIARWLDQAPGEPVFCIERATWWQRAAITFVTLSHRRGYRLTSRY